MAARRVKPSSSSSKDEIAVPTARPLSSNRNTRPSVRYTPAGFPSLQLESPFFRLPVEIRLAIFQEYFHGRIHTLDPNGYPPVHYREITKTTALSPLLVCRQMHNEAFDALFNTVRFVIVYTDQIDYLRAVPRYKIIFDNIRHIQLRPTEIDLPNYVPFREGPSITGADALAGLPRLQTAVIGFEFSIPPDWTKEEVEALKQAERTVREDMKALAGIKKVCLSVGWPRFEGGEYEDFPANTTVHRTIYEMNDDGMWEHDLVTEKGDQVWYEEEQGCPHCNHEFVSFQNFMLRYNGQDTEQVSKKREQSL